MVLENNRPMNRAIERMGASVVRRYRLYERGFDELAPNPPLAAAAPARSRDGGQDGHSPSAARRRRFAAAIAAAQRVPAPAGAARRRHRRADVAIVGAGLSGLAR